MNFDISVFFENPSRKFKFHKKKNLTRISAIVSPNTVRVIKWRRMRWAGHVARMGEGRFVHEVSVGEPDGK